MTHEVSGSGRPSSSAFQNAKTIVLAGRIRCRRGRKRFGYFQHGRHARPVVVGAVHDATLRIDAVMVEMRADDHELAPTSGIAAGNRSNDIARSAGRRWIAAEIVIVPAALDFRSRSAVSA